MPRVYGWKYGRDCVRLTVKYHQKKRAFPGVWSCGDDLDVDEIVPPTGWNSNSKGKSVLSEEVSYQEIFNIDPKDDSNLIMLSGDEEVGYSYKSKLAENAPFNNMVVAKVSDGTQYSKDFVGVGFSDQDFVYSDAYMNLFGDGSVFDNHYSLMQTQSDRTVIPPGFEALAQWFDGPIEIKKEVGSASSSSYSIPKVQLDSENHAYMDMFGSGSIALMQAQFDGRYIPPGIEASVPWSADPVDNKKKVGSASSSSYSISKVQLDSKGIGSSHSWEKNWIAPCSSSLQAEEAAAEQPYLTGSSSFPAVPESFHFDNKLETPSITGNSGLKMSTDACSLSSSLPRHPPLFISGQKKFDVSASSGYYPAHNNLGSVEFPYRWDPYDIRSPYPYNSQNKVLGKDKLTSYSPGVSTPKPPPSHSLNAPKSMEMASFSHQPSFSIHPFFKAPAGDVYPSPEENLGFNKTVNPAELSTASSGTMSMGMTSFAYQPSFSLDQFFQAPAGYFYLSPEKNLSFNKNINPAEVSTAPSGTMSMGIASFPYQPSFSVDSFFQAPAGYFYLSPEENLGFNKTVNPAELSTASSGTMSMGMASFAYHPSFSLDPFFQAPAGYSYLSPEESLSFNKNVNPAEVSTAPSGTMSMGTASFPYQPSFSVDSFFQAPAGYFYLSPEENLGFNKTVNPAELSTASSGTMSMGMASFAYQPSFSIDPFFQAPAGYFYLSPEKNLSFYKNVNPAEVSTAPSGTISMGIASFPYQPSFSVDSFFQAPAGYFYLSPEENLGFNKTISSAEHSTVPSGTMSSTMDYKNLDNIEKIFQEFKRFGTVEDYSDHYYAKDGSSITQQPRKWAKAIQEEWKSLEKDLPDAIFVRAYESRMDLLRAVIVGPQGTPYHDGLFFFDIFFPSSYPSNPPHVHYHSGGLRINPNLYECGKVCLSLLNTWTGSGNEKWIPNVSTMLQVLVSIQALVLNEEPYYNEPGHTKRAGGVQKSKNYNESTFILSLKTMVYSMKKPPKHFEEFVIGHFCKHAQDILSACKLYIEEGVQVGSVTKGKKNVHAAAAEKCSRKFAGDVASHITMLVKEFVKIGAKDCDKYLALAQKAGPGPNPFESF